MTLFLRSLRQEASSSHSDVSNLRGVTGKQGAGERSDWLHSSSRPTAADSVTNGALKILFIVILTFRPANSDPDTKYEPGVSARPRCPRSPGLILLLLCCWIFFWKKEIQSSAPQHGQTLNFSCHDSSVLRQWMTSTPLLAELAEKHAAAAKPPACVLTKDQTGSPDFGRTREVPLAATCNRRRNNGWPRGRPCRRRRRRALCPRWVLLMETPPSLLRTKGERQEEWMLTFFVSNGSTLNPVWKWGEANKL